MSIKYDFCREIKLVSVVKNASNYFKKPNVASLNHLFCLINSLNPNISHLQSHKTKGISKSSQLDPVSMYGILAAKKRLKQLVNNRIISKLIFVYHPIESATGMVSKPCGSCAVVVEC